MVILFSVARVAWPREYISSDETKAGMEGHSKINAVLLHTKFSVNEYLIKISLNQWLLNNFMSLMKYLMSKGIDHPMTVGLSSPSPKPPPTC